MVKQIWKKSVFRAFWGLFLLLGVSASAWAAPELKIVSVSPKASTARSGRTPVTVTFNQPVAALSEADSFSSANCPLIITPKIDGVCRYSGTQTLTFEPKKDLPQATSFDVLIKEGFKSKVSGAVLQKDYSWSFNTQRPEVESTVPYNTQLWMDLNPTLYAVFNMPPDLETVNNFVKVTYQADAKKSLTDSVLSRLGKNVQTQTEIRNVPLIIRPISEIELKRDFNYYKQNQVLAISVAEPLHKGTQYTLTLLPGLKSVNGPLGLEQERTLKFYTYPPLDVAGATQKGCLPYSPAVWFTSPVRLSEVVAAATVSPSSAVRTVSQSELDSLGREQIKDVAFASYFSLPLSFLTLTPGQPVTVTLQPGLKDIYGNKLGKEVTLTFTNDGYCPAAEFSGGFGVLESYLSARHPIDLMNITSLPVSAARFSKENFIPFHKTDIRYCEAAELKDATFNGEYSFPSQLNKTVKTFLNLEKFKPTSKDSIVFSQLRIPSKYREEGYCWVNSTDNITDIGITFKSSGQNMLVWATSLQNGESLPNLPVELRSSDNKVLWSGTTDMNGIALAPGWKEMDAQRSRWSGPEIFAFVTSPSGDAVVSSQWNQGVEPWRFNINYDYSPTDVLTKTALFSDRGIYRPGEIVYLKGVVRSIKDGAWTVPAIKKGTVTIYDSRGDEVSKTEVPVSSGLGTFTLEVPISKNAYTGSWQAYFKPEGLKGDDAADATYSFGIEAVKQAEFTVKVRADKPDYFSGEKASFLASADYLFGAPVAQGDVKWTLRQSTGYFNPKGYDGYTFIPYFLRQGVAYENGKLLREATGKLSDQGVFNFSVALPKVALPTDIYTEVAVQSPSRQQLFSRTSFTLNPAAFYLGAKPTEDNVEFATPFKADIIAVTPQGERVGNVKVTASIQKEEWFSVRKNGLSGRLEWVSDKKVTDFPSQTFTVDKKGHAFSFTPSEEGRYYITLRAKDEQGREVTGGLEFTAYGAGQTYWKQSDGDILKLKQDKDSYKVGQTAKILVESPYEQANALVSVEREGVLDSWTTPVRAGADYIEVPVKANYLPNVYVSVTLVRGRSAAAKYDKDGQDLAKPQGKTGYVNLTVSQETRRIKTTVKTNKEKYQPGQEVTVELTTKVKSKGVPAEVVVMVVDEGVLALTDYKTPELMDFFYGSRALSVSTADSRVFVIGQRNFGEKGESRGGGGGESKLGGADLRSNFKFTPYFNAAVMTDKKGRAEVTFKLPDNLTDFRVMAVALTEQEFGSAQTSIKVSKPIMLTPALPRFARKGDVFSCGAVVHNYEDSKGALTVTARATGAVSLAGPDVQTVQVPKGAAKEISWVCTAMQDGAAELAFSVRGRKDSDGISTKISVTPVEKMQTLSTYSSTDSTQEELLVKPTNLNVAAGNVVSASMASTALLNLKGAMLYLLTYPYDCLEQKMSKIVPVIEGAQLVQDFGLGDTQQMRAKVQEILDGVGEYQHNAGGFAYWSGALPDPYLTAYVLEVSRQASGKGYSVNKKALEKASKWLESYLAKKQLTAYPYSAAETKTARAYIVYVLGLYGRPVQSHFNNLYGELNALPLPARAYLLKASVSGKHGAAVREKIAQSVLNNMVFSAESIHFEADQQMYWLHINDTKLTALCLDALLYAKADVAQPYRAVKWLMTQLNAEGHWLNTNVNAAVFTALNTYYNQQENLTPDFTAQLTANTVNLMTVQFKGRSVEAKQAQFGFDKVYASSDQARVQLAKKGEGTLFYTLSQIYQPAKYTTPVDAGFSVSRSITDLTGKSVTSFKAGGRYKVTLKAVSTVSRSFVVLEDFVPAGFEIVNTSLATESVADAQSLDNSFWGGFERDEKYDDRIAAFADYLDKGEHTYSYLVQAMTPGTFSYPSLWASQMYDPATFGRNATQTLTVEK